jgi:hypothetical protein
MWELQNHLDPSQKICWSSQKDLYGDKGQEASNEVMGWLWIVYWEGQRMKQFWDAPLEDWKKKPWKTSQ